MISMRYTGKGFRTLTTVYNVHKNMARGEKVRKYDMQIKRKKEKSSHSLSAYLHTSIKKSPNGLPTSGDFFDATALYN